MTGEEMTVGVECGHCGGPIHFQTCPTEGHDWAIASECQSCGARYEIATPCADCVALQ